MQRLKKIGAILLMAGSGARMGNCIPKQFLSLDDQPLFSYALQTLKTSCLFDEIILVTHKDWMEMAKNFGTAVEGGETRQSSCYIGLKAFKTKPDIVLIHDAARPLVSLEILQKNVQAALEHEAVNTCIASADTLVCSLDGKKIANIPDRSQYMRGQTPQTFDYDLLLHAHEQALRDGILNASDDCQLVMRTGRSVHIVPGEENNIKITTALDLLIAQTLLRETTFAACEKNAVFLKENR